MAKKTILGNRFNWVQLNIQYSYIESGKGNTEVMPSRSLYWRYVCISNKPRIYISILDISHSIQ
jgi:hypothetical protein